MEGGQRQGYEKAQREATVSLHAALYDDTYHVFKEEKRESSKQQSESTSCAEKKVQKDLATWTMFSPITAAQRDRAMYRYYYVVDSVDAGPSVLTDGTTIAPRLLIVMAPQKPAAQRAGFPLLSPGHWTAVPSHHPNGV